MRGILAALLLLGGAALAPVDLRGQPGGAASVSGRVTDAETGAGLAGVHVFIAATMVGTVTDADGRYRLAPVPAGAHRLYASMIGFEAGAYDLRVRAGETYTHDFRLAPQVYEGPEITVTAERDPRWAGRLKKFERMFIGETDYADDTRLLNPEVLDFDAGWGRLAARASAPLVIENEALGYRIRYFLEEFDASGGRIRYDGEPLYEEMTPDSPAQAAMWEANRRRAFMGSFRHFLLALLADSTREAGFVTYIRPTSGRYEWNSDRFPLPASRIIKPGDSTGTVLDFHGVVEVIYLHEAESRAFVRWQHGGGFRRTEGSQTSFFRLSDGPTTVDATGEVVDPYGVTIYGYFAFERVADGLPKEYRPDE